MVTTEWLLDAYFDCRHSKRRTASAVVYEMDYESRLIALRDRINNRTYQPGKSVCFVVTRPRYREVFAASFEDRIVHHYIALRLTPLFEEIFSERTFNCRKGKGQLYGINTLDWYIENEGIKHHGRYVDDFYCIHKDKEKLLALMPKIRELLAKLGLRLNEKKFYLQHYSKGVEFTGSIVKPGRVYTCNRTITNFVAAVRRLNKANNERQVLHAVCSINSYLGLLRHTNEYATRRKVLNMIEPHVFKEYVYIKGHYEVLAIKNKHKLRYQTMQRIRNGDY